MKRILAKKTGQSLVEYALIIALIAVVCVLALRAIGSNTSDKLDQIATDIENTSP